MSVEMWVLLPWYERLFDDDIRDMARTKLALMEIDVEAELGRLTRRLQPTPGESG
jgi:hypothetical protein